MMKAPLIVFFVGLVWITLPAQGGIDPKDGPVTLNVQSSLKLKGALAGSVTTIYLPTTDRFPNPERGFYEYLENNGVWSTKYSVGREAGHALAHLYLRLEDYVTADLSQAFLDELASEFALARTSGVKIILRTSYNYGYVKDDILQGAVVASLDQILRHIAQLKPLLQENVDVIVAEEVGYLGAWGEWHNSAGMSDTDYTSRGAVLTALLDALPASRMVMLRYPIDLYMLHGNPTTAQEAFTGTDRARVGFYNLAVNSSMDDWTTFSYWGLPGYSVAQNKAFVAANSIYTATGGETAIFDPADPSYPDCAVALADLAAQHYSYLDVDWDPAVYSVWKAQGCYDEIDRQLGYRFELGQASYPSSAHEGATFPLSFTVTNRGYAPPFNHRTVYAVFQKGATRYVYPLATDPRHWAPGVEVTVSEVLVLPTNMRKGHYTLSLWLPDDAATLMNDPRYAVRFANQGVWEAATGSNRLASGIAVN